MYRSQPSDFETKFAGCYLIHNDEIYMTYRFRQGVTPGNCDLQVVKIAKKDYTFIPFNISLTYCEQEPSDIVIRDISMKNELFIHPPLGFINHDFYLLRFIRPHQKGNGRYRLGFHKDSVQIENMNRIEIASFPDVIRSCPLLQRPSTQNCLYSLFFPKFYSYEEAMKSLLNHTRLGVAITPTVAVKYCHKTNGIVLLKNEFTIGDYIPSLDKFILRTSIYKNELDNLGIPYENT